MRADGARRADQGPHRHIEPTEVFDHPAVEAPGRATVETDRCPDHSDRHRVPNPDRQRTRSQTPLRTSIPGLGEASAFAIVVGTPELGVLENKQAASLAGLAPVDRQSGQWKGKSFIQGGRQTLRQAFVCPPSSPPDSISLLRQNTKASEQAESLQKSP